MTWPPEPRPLAAGRTDVMGFGEAMVLLQPAEGVLLQDARSVDLEVAGAELNVCAAIASLGGTATLCTRLSTDPLASFVRREAARLRVGLRASTDPYRQTGLYLKDVQPDGVRRPYYYRLDSAASQMGPSDAADAKAERPRAVVVSGLTAALGPGPRALVGYVGTHAQQWGASLVVDVNLRPQLGNVPEVLSCLKGLMSHTKLLVVGTDEADGLFGTSEPARIANASLRAGCAEVVIKAGADGCWWMDASGTLHHMPSTAAQVVDPVGAGDAFTGGYLAARLLGGSAESAARLGSQLAAGVLAHAGDTTGLPTPARAHTLLTQLHD